MQKITIKNNINSNKVKIHKKLLKKITKTILSNNNKFQKKNIKLLTKKHFKLKKKWRFWRGFKRSFLNKKKITFYKKLEWNFNEKRLIWHQMSKSYLPNIKNILKNKINKKNSYSFFIRELEFRLAIILIRAKFYTKLVNSYNAIKNSLILVNGIIIKKITYNLQLLDMFQKKRHINFIPIKKFKINLRNNRLKWRKFRWKKARYIFWKIRRKSNFNLYLNKKISNTINYLEINYKIPAGIITKQPFIQEFLINRESKIINHTILKKIFFLY